LKNYPNNAVYVDLFGGSGLLSHTVKQLYPNATVIYNDFDNYAQRLENITKTNVMLSDIRTILIDFPKDIKITEPYRSQIIERLKAENDNGFVDWITLSSSILFSGKYLLSFEAFQKETYYNRVKMNDYDATGYLVGVKTVSIDYKQLFEQYKDNPEVVFLVDPPYLSTETSAYKCYWKLSDYLDVLNVLDGTRYFYFTSNKSSIIELCQWIDNSTIGNPFKYATSTTIQNQVNYNSSYTDIMLFK